VEDFERLTVTMLAFKGANVVKEWGDEGQKWQVRLGEVERKLSRALHFGSPGTSIHAWSGLPVYV
jgi:hypothetical protein